MTPKRHYTEMPVVLPADAGTARHTYLGTASYVKHEGSRPMNITWKLDAPIPAKYLKKTNKLMVG